MAGALFAWSLELFVSLFLVFIGGGLGGGQRRASGESGV